MTRLEIIYNDWPFSKICLSFSIATLNNKKRCQAHNNVSRDYEDIMQMNLHMEDYPHIMIVPITYFCSEH